MVERKHFELKSIVLDKNNCSIKESIDWTFWWFKQVYWGMIPSDEIEKKQQEINKSAKEDGYKILFTAKIKKNI